MHFCLFLIASLFIIFSNGTSTEETDIDTDEDADETVGIQSTNVRSSNPFRWLSLSEARQINRLTPAFDDTTGEPIYLCRGWHRDNWIPGMADRFDFHCYIAIDSQVVEKGSDGNDHQILFIPRRNFIRWVNWNGFLPKNILSIGTDPNNRQFTYVCRAKQQGLYVMGKVSGGSCFLPNFATGREFALHSNFEILVLTVRGQRALSPAYRL